jgi:hypothetical protein
VRTVDVNSGFKYNPSAFKTWGILSLTMMGYSTYAAGDFSTSDSLTTAWTYNWAWMFVTWGLSLFLWIQKFLFKSEGGAVHGLFTKSANFIAINYALSYWIIDILLLRGNLDVSSDDGWIKLGALFFL